MEPRLGLNLVLELQYNVYRIIQTKEGDLETYLNLLTCFTYLLLRVTIWELDNDKDFKFQTKVQGESNGENNFTRFFSSTFLGGCFSFILLIFNNKYSTHSFFNMPIIIKDLG